MCRKIDEQEYSMSRAITLLIILVVILAGFLTFRFSQNVKMPPSINEEAPPQKQPNSNLMEGSDYHKWREYSSSKGHFKIMLPGIPQHVTEQMTDPKTHELRKYDTIIAGGEGGPAFMVSIITLTKPVNSQNREEFLKNLVTEMLERNQDTKLKTMQMGNFHEFPSLDFSLTNGNVLVVGKVFVHDETVYVLSMANNSEVFNPQDLRFFIDSFEIVNAAAPETPS